MLNPLFGHTLFIPILNNNEIIIQFFLLSLPSLSPPILIEYIIFPHVCLHIFKSILLFLLLDLLVLNTLFLTTSYKTTGKQHIHIIFTPFSPTSFLGFCVNYFNSVLLRLIIRKDRSRPIICPLAKSSCLVYLKLTLNPFPFKSFFTYFFFNQGKKLKLMRILLSEFLYVQKFCYLKSSRAECLVIKLVFNAFLP